MTLAYRQAHEDRRLEQILALQRINTESSISADVARDQGFVTVRHDLALLRAMNQPDPHIVAVADDVVVGYALVMQLNMAERLPILAPMFAQFAFIEYRGRPLSAFHYFVMGQVCVARQWRGRGVFEGLYGAMREHYQARYDLVVTEVATRNGRSSKAHVKVGFETIHGYVDERGEAWEVIAWDWS